MLENKAAQFRKTRFFYRLIIGSHVLPDLENALNESLKGDQGVHENKKKMTVVGTELW